MKKVSLTFTRKAPLKGHTARVTYTVKTKSGATFTQTAVTCKIILQNTGVVVFPVYDIENIVSKITLKVVKPNRRLLLNKSYQPKDFVKLDKATIEIGAKGAFKAKTAK